MKNPYILKNILGIIIGMVIINSIVFIVAHLLSNAQNIPAMFTALLGSAVSFLLTLLLRIPVLQRKIVIGIILSFIGGFLTAIFFSNYRSTELQFEKEEIKKGLTIEHLIDLEPGRYFQFDWSKVEIMKDISGHATGADAKGDPEDYIVFPIIEKDRQAGDTIKAWAGYHLRHELFGKEEEHFLKQLYAPEVVFFRVKREYHYEIYNRAAANVKRDGMVSSAKPVILEIVDRELESSFWMKRFLISLSIINGLWLLATVGGVKKGFEVKKDQTS